MTFENFFEEICHHKLMLNKLLPKDFEDKKLSLAEKYDLNKKTIQIFTGYLGFLQS